MSSRNRNPATWDEYDRGGSPNRIGSISSYDGRSTNFEDDPLLSQSLRTDGDMPSGSWANMRQRRPSATNRLPALGDMGGVNSIRSFTRSWQRAAGFPEVIPQRPSFMFAGDQEPMASHDAAPYARTDIETGSYSGPRRSLLHDRLEAPFSDGAFGDGSIESGTTGERPLLENQPGADFRERERKAFDNDLRRTFSASSGTASTSIFAIPPQLATPELVGSYGSYRSYGTYGTYGAYGTIESDRESSMAQAADLWWQQQQSGANVPDGEQEPILVKEVEQDGKIVLTVDGQSTLPQTIFNSINVLIGVGLLSLPMGIKYAGWLCGMLVLLGAAAVTAYTARLLAKCMDLDPSLITFSDLAYISFGRNARIATSILFTLELLAACVALVVLFADSMELLFEGVLNLVEWKILCALMLIPLNFLPLRFLSFTSIIGIVCCFSIVAIVIADGLIKPHAPGSLLEPARTYLFPANWLTLPLSFGLLMSPWGGHSVFPNIYRDMRHPRKYGQAVRATFGFTCALDAATAVTGLLMFGDGVLDAVTSNILRAPAGYPRTLTLLMCCFIAVVPLTKIPLNARPIVSTAEVLLGLHQQSVAEGSPALVGRSAYFRGVMKIAIRIATILTFLVISIVFPAFDSIMAFMGSALCFTICVILPLSFHLKLFWDDISTKEKVLDWTLIVFCSIMSIVGTVWAFLPKSLIGAE